MRRLWKRVVFLAVVLTIISVQVALAKQVPLNLAKQVARNWMFQKTRVEFDVSSLLTAFTEKDQSNNIYYIINFPFGGWVIISADDVAHPIIAYAYKGSYSSSDTRPVQFDQWMENVKTQIKGAITDGAAPLAKTNSEWSRLEVNTEQFSPPMLDYATVGPLLGNLEWDQGTYYNQLCPADAGGVGGHVWAGCVATAMSQVMKYHDHPTTGKGSYSYTHATYGLQSANFGATTYNWPSMPDELTGTSTSTEKTAVATLIYHAGVSVDMDYDTSGSGASTSQTANSLKKYFKYLESAEYINKADYEAEWTSMLRTEINNSRPVIYRGSGTGGHAFVCDGYNNNAEDDYFHFNWGWSGYYNGFFYLDDLTPGSYNFVTGQAAVMGIAPITDPALTYPYSQGFESGISAEWITFGRRVSVSTSEANNGSQSLMLSTLDGTGWSVNNATLYIDVPPQGAILTFWVKRGYDPGASAYNNQQAILKTQYDESDLETFYNGDFNDTDWQEFTIDLTPWKGTNVKLFVEQNNNSSSWRSWTYLDDVVIDPNTVPGDIDANDVIDLADVVVGLQVSLNITPASTPDTDADVDGDGKIGMAEVIYVLQKVAGLR